ncbi:MutS protein msh5 [Halocaridina rubra]|uniref:MutS protein msh5 n=1 Tax=Halocaridina rubra TaxID=373956 RepID=A0AAN9A5G0_HALRR
MDRELGDIQVDIANHETRIMMSLLAFSVVSRECGWVKPELTDEPVIDIENARHPLYELCTPTFVANPIKSGNTQPYITLVTGPNSSGKTVYLKQVGVLAVLAQIGCWVPASSARLKPLAAILAVTHAMPPVISSLSSFMLDLSRMCSALDRATRHSLIIIDEFGATTYETDGAALLTASLDYWCQRTRPRYSNAPSEDVDNPYGAPPHVFVSTHLHQVYAHLQYQDAVRCLILETVEENGGLVPLYQVSEGRATKSYASAVAALAGVPPQIVTRSTHVCESIRSGKLPDRWELVKNEKERTRCEIIASMFISYDLNDPVEILFNKIQAFVASRKGVSTPASGIFTESSTSVTLEPGSNSEFTRSDTVTSSVDSKIGMNISCFNSFLSSSKKKSRKGKKSAALQSTSKHDHEEQGPSGIPLNWNVEAILSSGSSSHADLCRDSTST